MSRTDRRAARIALLSASTCAVLAVAALAWRAGHVPFFALQPLDVGVVLEPFGTIVAIGVVIGARVLHGYAARRGVSDTRDLTLWIVVTGAIGYALYVRWKRLPAGVVADATMLGLLVAFTIGRVACSVTHDHIGRATTF